MVCRVAQTLLLIVTIINNAISTYVITTPRKWTVSETSQTCVSLVDSTFAEGDSFSINVRETRDLKKELIPPTSYTPETDRNDSCFNVTLPKTENSLVNLRIAGSLSGKSFSENAKIRVSRRREHTFIQTDKSIYKPGQTVQFRILTLSGPFLDISRDNYSVVYVESPSNIRIGQWKEVDNRAGLVHLSFDLHTESSQGSYTIEVQMQDGSTRKGYFKVHEYVLPRYEVTINPPAYILGSDENVTLELCAKYTYGEPVKGVANLSVAIGTWTVYANVTQTKSINGCEKFTFNTTDLRFDDNNCHIRVSNLRASAVVIDRNTNTSIYGENFSIPVHRRAINFKSTSPDTSRKQHLPSVTILEGSYQSNKPAAMETVEVCTSFKSEQICKNVTSDAQGRIEVLVPSDHTSSLRFRAVKYPRIVRNFNDVMEESEFYKFRYRNKQFSDKHNSSISIFTGKELTCNDGKPVTFNLPLIYVAKDMQSATIYIQAIARGQIQLRHSQTVQFTNTKLPFDSSNYLIPLPEVPSNIVRGAVEIPVQLPNSVSPLLTILAWFKNNDGVVFADSAELDVTPCLSSAVEMSWSKDKVSPGASVDLLLTGDPNSLCSIGVVDKSVELLASGSNILTPSQLIRTTDHYQIRRWEGNQQTLKYCLTKYNNTERVKKMNLPVDNITGEFDYDKLQVYLPYTDEIEALHVFNDAGYFVFSDLDMEKEMCEKYFDQALKKIIADDNIGHEIRPVAISSQSFAGGAGITQNKLSSAPIAHRPPAADVSEPSNIEAADKQGTFVEESTQTRVYFPETWLWQLSTIPSSGQLSESHTVPDTITEWIGRAICVNSDTGVSVSNSSSVIAFFPFFVDLKLPSSIKRGEVLPVTMTVFNYNDHSLPVRIVLERSSDFDSITPEENGVRHVCIEPFDSQSVTLKVIAKIIGEMNITVEVATDTTTESCNNQVKPITDRVIRSIPVEPEGFQREKTWNHYLCAADYAAGKTIPPLDITAPTGIVEGSERSWISAMGDLLGPSIENLGGLINFPHGCGEQNMLNFAPNVYIRQYLDASGEGSSETVEKLNEFMESGYRNQLRFRHPDGSFSTFGTRDINGSTWLTAFVLKSFAQATPYIFIDSAVQTRSTAFLKKIQEKDGCFRSQGRVVNKRLQGGIGRTNENSLLTAYVASAFLESKINASDSLILSALKCIKTATSTHPYDTALRAYALVLADDAEAKATVDQLIAKAVTNDSTMNWDIPDQGKNSALSVETASYALMTMLHTDNKEFAGPIQKVVRWLTSMRNSRGGFVSTQDTVVALQALALFKSLNQHGPTDIAITVKSTGLEQSFIVQQGNKFLQQILDLPHGTSSLSLAIQGEGCALVQAVLRYNVLVPEESDAFTISGNAVSDMKCKFTTIEACASYTLPDGASNMAILEVSLISGYAPVKEDLINVSNTAPFKRYEVNGPKVLFYIEEITSEPVCASFKIYQEIEISNSKPGSIKVYDYYQPELLNEMTYTIKCSREVTKQTKAP